ncbi:type II secretion system protein [bacterium]|nr:type II secretion system protein [bacterium]
MKEQKSVALVNETNAVKCSAFTLAEVLITLAVVGVVAAMTLPTLISKVNDKVTENQMSVFKAKMIKGLNLTKTAGDLNNTYENTYDFLVNGLGKNLKMASICDSEHLRDCIPYESIKYEKKDGSEASVSVSDLKTAKKLKLEGGFEDVAAFVLADGTPVLISYDKTCEVDTEELDKTISSCVAGLYDINGSRKPNKFLNKVEIIEDNDVVTQIGDLRSFNGASVGSSCVGEINGLCFSTTAFYSKDILNELDEIPTFAPCNSCSIQTDYWAAALKYCEDKGGLPGADELLSSISSASGNVLSALGISNTSNFAVWSSEETDYYGDPSAYAISCNNGSCFKENYGFSFPGGIRGDDQVRAICVGK